MYKLVLNIEVEEERWAGAGGGEAKTHIINPQYSSFIIIIIVKSDTLFMASRLSQLSPAALYINYTKTV